MFDEFQVTHQIEPELQAQTPRMARYTIAAHILRFLGKAVWLGAIVVPATMAFSDIRDLSALQRKGVPSTATVIDKVPRVKGDSYTLAYRYTTPAGTFQERSPVTSETYWNTDIGQPLEITYLPSHPETSRAGSVSQAEVDGARWLWLVVVTAAVLLPGLAVVPYERRCRKQLRLLQHGIAVPGVIMRTDMKEGKSPTYRVTYCYPVSGQTVWASVPVGARFFGSVYIGVQLTVLCDPVNPKNSLPYRAITNAVL